MEKLKSVLKSQKLRLLLKSLFLGVGAYFAKSSDGLLLPGIFVGLAVLFYFRPAINLKNFWAAYFLNLTYVLIFPWNADNPAAQIFVCLLFAAVFGVILGVKNIIFLRRQLVYHVVYFIILAYLNFLFFAGTLGQFAQVAFALSIFLAAREFYKVIAKNVSALYSAVTALIYSELLWVISLLPIGYVSKSILAILTVFLSEDLLIHHFNGRLTRKVVLRNAIIFAILFTLVLKLSYLEVA